MTTQHSTAQETTQEQGIVVPLELEGLRILKQELIDLHAEGLVSLEAARAGFTARPSTLTGSALQA